MKAYINEQRQKRQTKMIFEKVQAAVAAVARQHNLDLVIADTKDTLPDGPELEKADIRALKAAIYQKDVLFAGERLDISTLVLNQLDAKFNAPAPAAAAPAPGPGAGQPGGQGAIPAAAGSRGPR